ncbi:MAG: thiamine-phosphate kinase [Bacteroidales bacterium]|nr:thiamine-phosphate kinase [Bacteroidales bacterium]MDD3665613.1 thiamine-phosphate kinase [Bacteroidales bacterium]
MFEDRSKKERTELSDLGEFGLIDYLTRDITPRNASTLKGIGDDAAVIDAGNDVVLVTTDQLNEGVHFDLSYTPLKHLGYKAAVVNFSDIYAMNGRPEQMVVGLSVSNRFSVEALDSFYEGLKLASERYGVDLVGGDTTSSASGMFVSITVIGRAAKEEVVYRHGAAENHLLCVSGDLGAAYMGLLLLEREKQVFKANPAMQPDLEGHDYVLERMLKPEARRDIVGRLREAGITPSAMIDISDGLASEVLHICQKSGVGAVVYEDKIPVDAETALLCSEFQIHPTTAALNGGEDYELLFTIPLADHEKIKSVAGVTVIGHITGEAGMAHLVTPDNRLITLTAQGWNHYTDQSATAS